MRLICKILNKLFNSIVVGYDMNSVIEQLEINSLRAQVDGEPFIMLDDAIEIVRSGVIE